ncbi:hypothetical protein DID88_001278 [Monilinia fructigena]|uniref:Uncharacterized protein n=1 Tax=Monilinia fructigena TaxID=38457 RepID=A0A395IY31_9HELO|nr:hypothetical protein DID88_001278 [Monilinia fructigena]
MVSWECTGGSMDDYWKYYRIAIQLGLGVGPNGPILKLRTVRLSRVRRYSGGKPPGGGVLELWHLQVERYLEFGQLNPVASAFKFGATIEEAIDDTNVLPPRADYKVSIETISTGGPLHGGENKGVSKKVAVDAVTTNEWKKAPIPDWDSLAPAVNHNSGGYQAKPTSWAYWQRIGGDDPEAQGVFFRPHPLPRDTRYRPLRLSPGEQIDMKASIATAMKALARNEQPVMPKLSAEEQAIIDQMMGQSRKEFENARGFDQEDDDVYIPTANSNWDPYGPKDQLAKGKESASSLMNMTNIPANYQSQPVVAEPMPGHHLM